MEGANLEAHYRSAHLVFSAWVLYPANPETSTPEGDPSQDHP